MQTLLTKREWLSVSILIALSIFSFEAWQSFDKVMSDSIQSLWHSLSWFSFLMIILFLGSVIWNRTAFYVIGSLMIFLPGLYFIRSWEYFLVGVLSLFLFFFGLLAVTKESEDHIHFHFFKSVRGGSFFFVLGLSLLLSTGYYISLKNLSWEEMIPRFRIGDGITKVIFKTASIIHPSFLQLSNDDMTVDDFLHTLYISEEKNIGMPGAPVDVQNTESFFLEMDQFLKQKDIPFVFDSNRTKTAEKLFFENGYKQMELLTGRPVSGDERFSSVLSYAVQNKLITLMNGNESVRHIPPEAFPFFLAILLFLTLLSLSSLIVPICIFIASILFFLFCKIEWITIATMPVEQEYLK